MNKLLDVNNVSISFIQYTKGLKQQNLKVITDLTLDIEEGEILAVLGSSGSGKSLLAHAILGILPDNADLNGEIKYNGNVLNQKAKEEIRLMSEYDYAVVNDKVELAAERVKKIIEAENYRVDRVIERYVHMIDDVKV